MIRHAVLTALGLSTLAHADDVRHHADGSVSVGNKKFATPSAWHESAEFRAHGRCGSELDSEAIAMFEAIAPTDCTMTRTVINPDYIDNRTFIIQVVFHVIQHTDGRGTIPEALIKSQLDILNEDFNALAGTPGAGGNNARIRFVLARFDPQGTPTTGINVLTNNTYFSDPGSQAPINPMKAALRWDPSRYFNIYTNNGGGGGVLGYATFPQRDANTMRDGVVLAWEYVGRNAPMGGNFNLGRTLTHEVGHYLGLYHTFQGACGMDNAPYTSGDLISDTSREKTPNFGCAPRASECPGAGMDPIENYMDYSDDRCMTKFSVEQVNRMRCSMVNYRKVNTEPKAGFTASSMYQDATFTSTSTDAESATAEMKHLWSFGDGQTSTEVNPVHAYAAAGTYEVTLEVVDPGSGSSTFKQMVTVEPTPPPMPDAGTDGGEGSDGGGCCDAQNGAASSLALALPLLFVMRRRRRTV